MKQPEALTQLLSERKEENGTYIKTQFRQLHMNEMGREYISQNILFEKLKAEMFLLLVCLCVYWLPVHTNAL